MAEEIKSETLLQPAKSFHRNRNSRLRATRGKVQRYLSVGQGDLGLWGALVIFVLVAASVWLFSARPAELPVGKALLGLLITWLGFLPLVFYFRDVNRPPVPFLPLVGAFYAIQFGLTIFTVQFQQQIPNLTFHVQDVSITSLWLTVAGMVGFYLAFYAGRRFFWRGIRPVHIPWDGGSLKFRLFLWGGLAMHLAFYAVPVLHSIPSVGQLVEPIGLLGWGMVLVLGFARRLSLIEKYLLAPVGLIIELLFRSTTGLLSTTVIFGLFLSVIAFRFRPRLSLILAVLSILFLVLLSPVKFAYRQMTWNGDQSNASLSQRITLLTQLTADHYASSGFNPANEDNITTLAGLSVKLSIISLFSSVVDMTPNAVPYWNGATYTSLLTKWIPRFLWPGKPQELTGNEFGRRYGFLEEDNTMTSLNLPWIVEAYANFGAWGVLLGMSIFGALMALPNRLFNQPQANPIEFVYGATMLFGISNQGSSFAMTVGNVLLLSIALYVMLKLATDNGGRKSRRPPARNADF